jgi:beta-lactamase class A
MDQNLKLGTSQTMNFRILITVIPLSLLLGLGTLHAAEGRRASTPAAKKNTARNWQASLLERLEKLDADYPGELGVYVKDLATGQSLSFRGDESWYVASGIKVLVAIEVFRQIEADLFTLETRLRLKPSDVVDGAGHTNRQARGSWLTVRYLLEEMLIYSDNTATDMLIRLVGLDNVNATGRSLIPAGFFQVTTLADVRRHAYAGLHPKAFTLTGNDLLEIRRHPVNERIEALARVLKVSPDEFAHASLDAPFSAYYATHLNSASLDAYGALLEMLASGKILSAASTQTLMEMLKNVQTGQDRIKAGLPKSVRFAHKTGTQYARICDMGITFSTANAEADRVIIVACSRGLVPRRQANKALRQVGEAVAAAGAFEPTRN